MNVLIKKDFGRDLPKRWRTEGQDISQQNFKGMFSRKVGYVTYQNNCRENYKIFNTQKVIIKFNPKIAKIGHFWPQKLFKSRPKCAKI